MAASQAVSTISFDFCYTGTAEADQKMLRLVVVDSHSRMVHCGPTTKKDNLKQLATEVVRFVQTLGYHEVEIMSDNEPSLVALREGIVGIRNKMGLITRCNSL